MLLVPIAKRLVTIPSIVYYYTTYDNSQINAVDMHKEDLDGDTLKTYQLNLDESINRQN